MKTAPTEEAAFFIALSCAGQLEAAASAFTSAVVLPAYDRGLTPQNQPSAFRQIATRRAAEILARATERLTFYAAEINGWPQDREPCFYDQYGVLEPYDTRNRPVGADNPFWAVQTELCRMVFATLKGSGDMAADDAARRHYDAGRLNLMAACVAATLHHHLTEYQLKADMAQHGM